MKTERRHELQTNTLADTLGRWIEVAQPYSRAAMAAVIAACVVVFVWVFLSKQNQSRVANGWEEYSDTMLAVETMGRDPIDRLTDLSQRYAGTSVGQWSRLSLADYELNKGTNELLMSKERAHEDLQKAAEGFQTLLHETHDETLKERATFGVARAHEAMGQLNKASEEYLSLAKQWPDSVFAESAKSRADDLSRAETKSFYDWLAKYEPPRPMNREPGKPGVKPEFLKDALDEPPLTKPSAGDTKATADFFKELTGDKPLAPEPGASDAPAGEPASDKPATENPAPAADADKPAAENK